MFFRFNTLKGVTNVPAIDFLMLNTLRGTKTIFFLTSKRYESTPIIFHMRVPPGIVPRQKRANQLTAARIINPEVH